MSLEMLSDDDVLEMARLQAVADKQPLVDLLRGANVKSRQDMPKLWAYLRNRQIKEEEDKKKKRRGDDDSGNEEDTIRCCERDTRHL